MSASDRLSGARRRSSLFMLLLGSSALLLGACGSDEGASTTTTTSDATTSDPGIGPQPIEGTLDEVGPVILEQLNDQGDTCDTALLIGQIGDMPPPATPDEVRMAVQIISKGYLAMSRIIDQTATDEIELLTTASDAVAQASDSWAAHPENFLQYVDQLNAPLIPAFQQFNRVLDDCVLGGIAGGTPDGNPEDLEADVSTSTTNASAAA